MDVNMDPRVWSRLPNHLLERILSFLPLKTFLDLRSTCKHFNSLLFTPHFISKHSLSSSSFSSFIILSHPQSTRKCYLFNTGNNSWCEESHMLSVPGRILSSPLSSNLLSSSNGLICFSIPSSSCFVVYNPLAKSFRRVSFPTCLFEHDSVTLVSTDNGYKLFVLSSSAGSSNPTLVYSSSVHSWRRFEGSSTPVLNESCHQKGVFYKGCLFFTTLEPFHVVYFHLESGRWEGSTVGLPGDLTFVRVASDGYQKLYLVGGVGTSGISRSVKIWELGKDDQGGDYWIEVETLPEMVCRKFVSVCYHNYEHVCCFWHQGLICLCCYTWPEMLYYKVSRGTWHWLPKCPSLPEKWSCGFKWFSFKPELYAIV